MKDFVEQYWEQEALPALIEFGKIPNESPEFDPEWEANGHMQKAAELLAHWAKNRPIKDISVELVKLPGKTPLLFIEVPGNKEGTVLMYGHLDKQPGMDGQWDEGLGPWSPVRKGELLYGRGLADDGYSIFAALGAVEAVQQAGEVHPRIVVIIEASEETGSIHLPDYLTHLKERIGTPSVVITLDADTRTNDALWFTESLRGLVNGTLTVRTLKTGLHSGMGSGMVPSAFRILRILLARIENPETGTITNPVLNPPITDAMREKCRILGETLGENYVKDFDLPEGLQAERPTIPEVVEKNLWEAGLEVIGIDGLPKTKEAGNLLAPEIAVKVSIRISPSVDSREAVAELKRVFEENPPYGAKVTFTPDASGNGWLSKPFSEKTNLAATKAAQAVYGTEPKGSGVGASIPFIEMMVREFPEADNLVVGVLEPTTHEHGPNENMNITNAKNITEWTARFLAAL